MSLNRTVFYHRVSLRGVSLVTKTCFLTRGRQTQVCLSPRPARICRDQSIGLARLQARCRAAAQPLLGCDSTSPRLSHIQQTVVEEKEKLGRGGWVRNESFGWRFTIQPGPFSCLSAKGEGIISEKNRPRRRRNQQGIKKP